MTVACQKPNRILVHKPPQAGRVVARPIVVQTGAVVLAAGVLEGRPGRAGREHLAERLVGVFGHQGGSQVVAARAALQ